MKLVAKHQNDPDLAMVPCTKQGVTSVSQKMQLVMMGDAVGGWALLRRRCH